MRRTGMDSSDCRYGITTGFCENNNISSYSPTSLLASDNYRLKKYYVTCCSLLLCTGKGKGKVQPRTGRESPEGEQRYSSTLSLTSVLERCGWSTQRSGRFTPGKDPVPILQDAGWAPEPVWTGAENLAHHRNSIPGPSSP